MPNWSMLLVALLYMFSLGTTLSKRLLKSNRPYPQLLWARWSSLPPNKKETASVHLLVHSQHCCLQLWIVYHWLRNENWARNEAKIAPKATLPILTMCVLFVFHLSANVAFCQAYMPFSFQDTRAASIWQTHHAWSTASRPCLTGKSSDCLLTNQCNKYEQVPFVKVWPLLYAELVTGGMSDLSNREQLKTIACRIICFVFFPSMLYIILSCRVLPCPTNRTSMV